MSTQKSRVALLGLGIMGSGMARRLLGAGFRLAVYNRTPEKAATLVAEGASPADTPLAAATGAEIIISMVADDAASRAVWLGRHGILAGVEPGALLIESSTLTPEWIGELAYAATKRGCELLDAPVTGTKIHAASGELCFLAGGSKAGLEKALPVLKVMSRAVVHAGPSGSGALLKLINNFLCGVQAVALGEALALIEEALRGVPGPFALEAAIAAEHCKAARPEDTNWSQIVKLYDLLAEVMPSPIVSLNRAVAIAMADGPRAALELIDELAATGELDDYHLLHAARADMLRRLGDNENAAESYEAALNLATNDSERRFLERRLREMRSLPQ